MHTATLRIACYAVMLTLSQITHSFAGGNSNNESNRSYIISGMRAEREKLLTGQLVMRGEHLVRAKGEAGFVVPIQFHLVFDHVTSSYRYNQTEAKRPPKNQTGASKNVIPKSPKMATVEEAEWQSRKVGGTLVRTNEYDLHLALNSSVVTRLSPGEAEGTLIYEPDVRCAGLLGLLAFERSVPFQKALEAYEHKLSIHSIHRTASGLWELKYRHDDTETEMWVDESHGMTPIRLIVRDLREWPKEMNRKEIVSTTEVDWKLINNNWVPISLRMSATSPIGSFESYELTVEWSNVNEPLDPKIFTAAGIVDSDNAIVMDMRLGPIVMEQVKPKPLPVAVTTPKPVQPKPPSRLGWIVLGHLVAGGGFAWWYYRRRARRQST